MWVLFDLVSYEGILLMFLSFAIFFSCWTESLHAAPCGGQEGFWYENPDGSTGGFVAKGVTLQRGASWFPWQATTAPLIAKGVEICDEVTLKDGVRILDEARIRGSVVLEGEVTVQGRADISGHAYLRGSVQVSGEAKIHGFAVLFGRAVVEDSAVVMERAQVSGLARVGGHANIGGASVVQGRANVGGQVTITGSSLILGQAQVLGRGVLRDVTLETGVFESSKEAINDLLERCQSFFEVAMEPKIPSFKPKGFFCPLLLARDVPFSQADEGTKIREMIQLTKACQQWAKEQATITEFEQGVEEKVLDEMRLAQIELLNQFSHVREQWKSIQHMGDQVLSKASQRDMCPICLNALGQADRIVQTYCHHRFCYPCLQDFVQGGTGKACPVCRSELFLDVLVIAEKGLDEAK
jgi:carbonic anhydrase/acetyltransferase-like protein (isoleucine patch superfamily)